MGKKQNAEEKKVKNWWANLPARQPTSYGTGSTF